MNVIIMEGCAEWQGTALEKRSPQGLVGSSPTPSVMTERSEIKSKWGLNGVMLSLRGIFQKKIKSHPFRKKGFVNLKKVKV